MEGRGFRGGSNEKMRRMSNVAQTRNCCGLPSSPPWGHVTSHTKFRPDRFSRFDVYWIQTNRHTYKLKEMSLCHKLWSSNPYICWCQRRKPLTFQTMTFVRSNNINVKYQRFMTLGSKDIGIKNSEFVAQTQFLYI